MDLQRRPPSRLPGSNYPSQIDGLSGPSLPGQRRRIPVSTSTPLGWAERLELVLRLLFHKGALTTVKIALIGRPGRIIEKGEVVFTSMPRFDAPSGGQAMAVFTPSTTTKLLQQTAREKQKQATG